MHWRSAELAQPRHGAPNFRIGFVLNGCLCEARRVPILAFQESVGTTVLDATEWYEAFAKRCSKEALSKPLEGMAAYRIEGYASSVFVNNSHQRSSM
jgi:hypothetical protein